MSKTELTADRLRELLHYDPETGVFTWLVSPIYMNIVGKPAGTITSQGYRAIRVSPYTYRASRLAWLYVHGSWPSKVIDHINGVRDDDRIVNLRDITCAENTHNICTTKSTSSSGLLGAFKNRGVWRARIMVSGARISLGTFATPELAHNAYMLAKSTYHPTSMRGVIGEH